MKRAYIAGKVTGLPYEEVKAKFAAKEAELVATKEYDKVFNPITFVKEKLDIAPFDEAAIMRFLLSTLIYPSSFTHLILLPDWYNSPNTLVEIQVAKACGIEVVYPENNEYVLSIGVFNKTKLDTAFNLFPDLTSELENLTIFSDKKMKTTIPFSIEAYNTGKYDVVTRDGRSVVISEIFTNTMLSYAIKGFLENFNDSEAWTLDGTYLLNHIGKNDLFLKPKKA